MTSGSSSQPRIAKGKTPSGTVSNAPLAHDVLDDLYLPEAVLVSTLDDKWMPALCYICPHMEPRPADAAYVERILGPARGYGFPQWYLDRLGKFFH